MKLLLIVLALLLSTSLYAREIDRVDYTSWNQIPESHSGLGGEGQSLKNSGSKKNSGIGSQGGGDRTQRELDRQDYTERGTVPAMLEQGALQKSERVVPTKEEYDRVLEQMVDDGYLIWDPATKSLQPPLLEM